MYKISRQMFVNICLILYIAVNKTKIEETNGSVGMAKQGVNASETAKTYQRRSLMHMTMGRTESGP